MTYQAAQSAHFFQVPRRMSGFAPDEPSSCARASSIGASDVERSPTVRNSECDGDSEGEDEWLADQDESEHAAAHLHAEPAQQKVKVVVAKDALVAELARISDDVGCGWVYDHDNLSRPEHTSSVKGPKPKYLTSTTYRCAFGRKPSQPRSQPQPSTSSSTAPPPRACSQACTCTTWRRGQGVQATGLSSGATRARASG